jgi:hypothetical protein
MGYLKFFLLILFILCLNQCTISKEKRNNFNLSAYRIYVNPTTGIDNGRDGRDSSLPIKTLDKAGAVCNNGDTIFIRGGTHHLVNHHFRRDTSQTGWVYIMPFFNEPVTLDGSGAISYSWDAIVTIESSRKVSIKGINFNNSTSQNEGIGLRVNSYFSMSRDIIIDSCKTNNTKRQGIHIQGSYVKVNNCEISNAVLSNMNEMSCSWESALQSYVDIAQPMTFCYKIEFTNNKIHNCWGEGIDLVRTDSFKVYNNIVYNCYSVSIYVDNSYNGEINNNWIYTNDSAYDRTCLFPQGYKAPATGILWAAEGGSYKYDRMIENLKIYNNLIYSSGPAFGWYHDDSNTYYNNSYRNIKIYYNTVYIIKAWESFYIQPVTVTIAPPTGCEFRNNIIPKARYYGIEGNYFTPSQHYYQTDKWVFSNNCFIDSPIPPALPPGNNIQGNPSFINPAVNNPVNFKIPVNSICNNTGVAVSGVDRDYWYSLRDNDSTCIGFHEYGGIPLGWINSNYKTPLLFYLYQNFPNPFNPVTEIKFSIPKNNLLVQITIYDITGREVTKLVNQQLNAGIYKIKFNAENLSSGVYFYTLNADYYSETKKMLMIK